MKPLFSSIWFLGLVVAIPLVIFIPARFEKYFAEQTQVEHYNDTILQYYFVDLNSDGKKEKIKSFVSNSGRFGLHYFTDNPVVPDDQLNFPFSFSNRLTSLYFGDTDNNGYVEIYGFTLKTDSLYLSRFQPLPGKSGKSDSKFITRINYDESGGLDFRITEVHFIDLNRDGNNEIIFPVVAGHSRIPRNIYVYNPIDNSVRNSGYIGINLYNLKFIDLDGDGEKEIIFDNASSGNLKDSLGNYHTDIYTWLMILDTGLQPVFAPKPYARGLQNKIAHYVTGESNKSILTFSFTESEAVKGKVIRSSLEGVKIDSITLPNRTANEGYSVFQLNDSVFAAIEGKYLTRITSTLKVLGTIQLPIPEMSNPVDLVPFFRDDLQLFLFDFFRKKLIILTENFKEKVELDSEVSIGSFNRWNLLENGRLFFISGNTTRFFQLKKNSWFYLKYPYYLTVYLLSVVFIWFIQTVRIRQLRKQYEFQNRIRELELKSFQSQLDPHFISNVFTTIASLMKKGNNDEAYNAFVKFSKLVRLNFEYSQNITRPLKDEMQVVTSFLEINKLRFRDNLDYSVDISDENLLWHNVPKMALQIHIENAIKHGLSKKPGKGKLKVRVNKENDFIHLLVEDDGIGRINASLLKRPSTKQGLRMLEAIYERLNQINKQKIRQNFTDLFNENNEPAGTRVEIWIPLGLKE